VFTTELRAKANAVVQVIHYSISLVITQCSPIALEKVGWKYYVSPHRLEPNSLWFLFPLTVKKHRSFSFLPTLSARLYSQLHIQRREVSDSEIIGF
jgi:hypothetical protein